MGVTHLMWNSSAATLGRSESAELTWARVGDGGCRHGDGNANTAAAAVLPAATSPAASTEGGRGERGRALFRATRSDGCTADIQTGTNVLLRLHNLMLNCEILLTHLPFRFSPIFSEQSEKL